MFLLTFLILQSSDQSFDFLNDNFIATKISTNVPPSASTMDQSSTSTVSITLNDNDDCEAPAAASNEHKVLVETICNISDAMEQGNCNIRQTTSIASNLDAQHESKQLETVDYERLKRFIDKAADSGLVFNDLNALYNYFIQESCCERYERAENEKLSSTTSSNAANQHHQQNKVDWKSQPEEDVISGNVAAASTAGGGAVTPGNEGLLNFPLT